MIKAAPDIYPTTKHHQERIRQSLPSVMRLQGFKTKF